MLTNQGHRYQTISSYSDRVAILPTDHMDLHTLSDVPGFPEDEELDAEYHQHPHHRSLQRPPSSRQRASVAIDAVSFAKLTDPRVILINTADAVCRNCHCQCRNYCAAYCNDCDREGCHSLKRGAVLKGGCRRQPNRRITFNPDPELCYDEVRDVQCEEPTRRPLSVNIPTRIYEDRHPAEPKV